MLGKISEDAKNKTLSTKIGNSEDDPNPIHLKINLAKATKDEMKEYIVKQHALIGALMEAIDSTAKLNKWLPIIFWALVILIDGTLGIMSFLRHDYFWFCIDMAFCVLFAYFIYSRTRK